jgi:hypothetical protein
MADTLEYIVETWQSGGVVMLPLLLVALLIYTVATSLLLNFRQRGYKHLDDETVIDWVRTPGKSEGEVGEIIRYTQDEVESWTKCTVVSPRCSPPGCRFSSGV